jgi:hypothetical protein
VATNNGSNKAADVAVLAGHGSLPTMICVGLNALAWAIWEEFHDGGVRFFIARLNG